MASFISVPYADIITLLSVYNQPIGNNEIQNYQNAWKLVTSGTVGTIPVSIADFILAYNLRSANIILPLQYTVSQILFSLNNGYEIVELPKLLGLTNPETKMLSGQVSNLYSDRERIIRILSYYDPARNDMSIFNKLPFEILAQIAERLGCREISLFCKLSKEFTGFCQSGQLEQVLRNKLQPDTRIENPDNISFADMIRRNLSKMNLRELQKQCLLGKTKHIIASSSVVYLLTPVGTVYGFGIGEYGQLGIEIDENADINFSLLRSEEPRLIEGLTDIVQISCKRDSLLALNSRGEVYGLGANISGNLGTGDDDNQYQPTFIMDGIIQVSTGSAHSLVLNDKGQVFSFGKRC